MKKKPQYTGLEVLEKECCRRIFKYLQKNGDSYYSEIKKALDMNNGSATYALQQLEKAELVVVDRPEGSGRKNFIRISGHARALLARGDKGNKKGPAISSLSVGEYLYRGMEMEKDG